MTTTSTFFMLTATALRYPVAYREGGQATARFRKHEDSFFIPALQEQCFSGSLSRADGVISWTSYLATQV